MGLNSCRTRRDRNFHLQDVARNHLSLHLLSFRAPAQVTLHLSLGHYGEKKWPCVPLQISVSSASMWRSEDNLWASTLTFLLRLIRGLFASACARLPDLQLLGMLQCLPPTSWWGLQVLALLHPACIWVRRGLKSGCQACKAIALPPEASLQPSILHPCSDGHCGGDRVTLGPIHSALRSSLLLNSLCGFFPVSQRAGIGIQGLEHTKQALHHWATALNGWL